MDTQRIANRLIELCRKAEYANAQNELYAENAVSIEPEGSPAEGLAALNAKAEKWNAMVEEIHSTDVSDPLVAGNFFSVKMVLDISLKGGVRNRGEQIAIYEVKDGKIVREQFFYST
jgi:ketosteroid isomerase-like protein